MALAGGAWSCASTRQPAGPVGYGWLVMLSSMVRISMKPAVMVLGPQARTSTTMLRRALMARSHSLSLGSFGPAGSSTVVAMPSLSVTTVILA